MRGPGRTAWRAHRAAARTTALIAVLVASGLAAGAASASGTQDTATPGASLIYRCGFPSGTRQVPVTVSAVVPATAKTGKPIQPAGVSLTLALPPAAASGLASLHSAAVSAATRLTISASDGPSGTSVVWPGVTKRPVPRSAHGSVTLTTTGAVPPVTASSPGEVILTAAGLSVRFNGGTAALAPGPARPAASAANGMATAPAHAPAPERTATAPAHAPVPGRTATAPATAPGGTAQAPLLVKCTLAPGQRAALGALVVTGKAGRAAHRNAAVTTGVCPKLPKGGLKLNPRFPPPPHPPLTLMGHAPSQGCAYTTGYANVLKLKGAALIAPALTNVDQALTALANTTNKINYLQLKMRPNWTSTGCINSRRRRQRS